MIQPYKDFQEYFNKSFWKSFSNAYHLIGEIKNKEAIVKSLYEDIKSRNYYPSIPKIFLYEDKGNSIARTIPVFEVKDYCLYYYCIKRLEREIALNRIENTFGGWTLGGLIRKSEEDEIEKKTKKHNSNEEILAEAYGVSITEYSFNPKAWSRAYGDFNSKLYATSKDSDYKWLVEFDISNFYDCIRLDLLEIWVREIAKKESTEVVGILFHFLNYWNRGSNNYNKQTVGLPQDAVGDFSRILANFYLQDYDHYMFKLCKKYKCRYLRYADDQFIFGASKKELEYITFLASKKLNCYGLSINQKKVKYSTTEDLIEYRSFAIFDEIQGDKIKIKDNVEKFIDSYFSLRNSAAIDDVKNRGTPLLRRSLSCDLNIVSKSRKAKIVSYMLEDSFLIESKIDHLNKLYKILNKTQKKILAKRLKKIASSTYHNNFHYKVLAFFKTIGEDTKSITDRINRLKTITL